MLKKLLYTESGTITGSLLGGIIVNRNTLLTEGLGAFCNEYWRWLLSVPGVAALIINIIFGAILAFIGYYIDGSRNE